MTLMRTLGCLVALLCLTGPPALRAAEPLAIGSKADIEGEILGNMLAQLSQSAGTPAHFGRLGGTQIAWQALRIGQIDAYPEYTGTLSNEIFAGKNLRTSAELQAALKELGLAMSKPLGFNNTYAIGMKEATAARLGITNIADLAKHPGLRLGFSNEFMGRADGWKALQQRYGLPQTPTELDHGLVYGALQRDELDAIELYSTDPKIAKYQLRVLQDDRDFFPKYEAVILYRLDSARRAPQAFQAMFRLQGKISAAEMIELNEQVDDGQGAPAQVAAGFLAQQFGIQQNIDSVSVWEQLWINAREHVFLVAVSLAAAIVIAVPLGVISARNAHVGRIVLAVVGVLQTIPSLALLVFMIPLLGLKAPPTIGALFLYSLLPIVRNTYTGLHDIPNSLRESAEALGLSRWAQLWRIELPLAARTILAGIKTAAVINVGTATIGGLIGAGGFGKPIVTGLTLDDRSMILWQGAVPAAVLALLVQGLFDLAERFVVPAGLRLPAAQD